MTCFVPMRVPRPLLRACLFALALVAGPAFAQDPDAGSAEHAPIDTDVAPAALEGEEPAPDDAPAEVEDPGLADEAVTVGAPRGSAESPPVGLPDASAAESVPEAEQAPPARRPKARRRRGDGERWVRGHVPDSLETKGLLGLEWWQWIGLPLLALVSAGAGRILGGVTRASLDRVVRSTPPPWDDELLAQTRGPLVLAWTFGAAWALLGFLYLVAPAEQFLTQGLRVGLLGAMVWVGFRAMDIGGVAASQSALAKGRAGAVSIVPLVVRSSQIALVVLGIVVALSSLGYPVTSLLAGLGIGGLGLALAAQKTAENMFGSVSLGVDQPLRVGDIVKIEDFIGVVEAIGLRSTRIRTRDRTIVTLPNGRLADMRIENYTVRDRMHLYCLLPLEHTTTPDQIRAVLAALEAALRTHPKLWPELVAVRFSAVSSHSLDVTVSAWFLVSDPDAMVLIKQGMLLDFLDVLSRVGVRLAYPTQTLHLVQEAG